MSTLTKIGAACAAAATMLLAGCSSGGSDPEKVASAMADLRSAALDEYKAKGYDSANGDGSLVWLHLPAGTKPYEDCMLGPCSVYQVLATEGCSDVYIEANFLDSSGTVVDWSNGTAKGLGKGKSAIITLQSTKDSAEKSQITEATCR